MNVDLPSKRNTILYARVTEKNKAYITKLAKKKEVSESSLIDHIIERFRSASNKRKTG